MATGGGARGLGAVLLLLSAVPVALLLALERRKTGGGSLEYRSLGWVRESLQWDADSARFLVSTFFDGGVSEIAPQPTPAREKPFLLDPELAGNSSLGIALDPPRRRLLVVYGDPLRHRSSLLAAYDLASRRRLFLAPLAGAASLADDVAVAPDGAAFVTDAASPRIWKLSPAGALLSTISSPLFRPRPGRLRDLVGLNGVVHHPSGFLLVIHTGAGVLFRVDVETEDVAVVPVAGGPLLLGDGLALLSPSRLVVAAGVPSARLVESSDGWATAAVTRSYYGPLHRIAASAAVKDGRVFLQHLLGAGSHVITEATFSP
ncbi:calcium-dependent phosphotriesterase superfamily protein [Wolffia australiana]